MNKINRRKKTLQKQTLKGSYYDLKGAVCKIVAKTGTANGTF